MIALSADTPETARMTVAELGLTFPVLSDESRTYIRAYDVRTGQQRWLFHTIPHPGEAGYETWPPEAWQTSGAANSWGGMTVDHARGIVFLSTGSATFDFHGWDRHGDNLFANCVIALNARTGERVWHFQTVHHDMWDYDLPCPPNLVTITRGERRVDAVAQVTKTGFIFLLERDTGEPLFPVEERPVPASDLRGEQAAGTQPFALLPPPLTRQGLTEADLTDRTPAAHADALQRYRAARPDGLYVPLSVRGTIMMPGTLGGANWSGAAVDPARGILYVNVNELPYYMTMKPTDPGSRYPFVHTGWNHFRDPDGYPAIKPPWGTLNAVDLNTGERLWQVPLGTYPELAAQGWTATGTENFGGAIVTAGGLVFIGASKDEKFRAFDADTGHVLWESALPFGGYATPATYEVEGRQYIIIAAGGGGKLKTKSGDAYVAFALP